MTGPNGNGAERTQTVNLYDVQTRIFKAGQQTGDYGIKAA